MTLALTIVRGLQPIILAPLYVLAQLLGGIIGAALARVNVYPYVVLFSFCHNKQERRRAMVTTVMLTELPTARRLPMS